MLFYFPMRQNKPTAFLKNSHINSMPLPSPLTKAKVPLNVTRKTSCKRFACIFEAFAAMMKGHLRDLLEPDKGRASRSYIILDSAQTRLVIKNDSTRSLWICGRVLRNSQRPPGRVDKLWITLAALPTA